MSLDTSVLSDGPNSKRYTHSVNSLKDGHLWEWNLVSIFERILTESQIKEVNKIYSLSLFDSHLMEGPSLGVHFTKLSDRGVH